MRLTPGSNTVAYSSLLRTFINIHHKMFYKIWPNCQTVARSDSTVGRILNFLIEGLNPVHFAPGTCTIKHFTVVIYGFSVTSQSFLPLTSLSSLVQCLWVRPGAYHRVEHLKSASLVSFRKVSPGAYPRVGYLKGASLGQAPALPANTRLGCKGLSGTNTLAYCGNP